MLSCGDIYNECNNARTHDQRCAGCVKTTIEGICTWP